MQFYLFLLTFILSQKVTYKLLLIPNRITDGNANVFRFIENFNSIEVTVFNFKGEDIFFVGKDFFFCYNAFIIQKNKEVAEHPYNKGDRFVLCTDGFWGAMPEEEFIKCLSENKPIDKVLESTANQVESIGRKSGTEYDNLTVAILEMEENSILKSKKSRLFKISVAVLSVLLLLALAAGIVYWMNGFSWPWNISFPIFNR